MVACNVAHTLFNVPTKIARIRQQDYLKSRWQDLFRSQHVDRRRHLARGGGRPGDRAPLEVPGATNCVAFADDKVRLVGVRAEEDCPRRRHAAEAAHLPVPRPPPGRRRHRPRRPVLHPRRRRPDPGRRRGALRRRDGAHIGRALAAFGFEERLGDRLVIGGGGNVGMFLAREIERRHPEVNVKLIEADPAEAESGAPARRVVLKGDIRDRAPGRGERRLGWPWSP